MRCVSLIAVVVAGLMLPVELIRADSPGSKPPSPLRFIPVQADAVLQIHQPGKLLSSVEKLDVVQQFLRLAPVKEQLGSTNVRRFFQLLAYFEKSLGAKYPDLLDRLAGGGIAMGIKYAEREGPFVLVLQGTDEKLAEQFLTVGLSVIESELARQESKERLAKGEYNGITGYKLGNLLLTRVGSALIASNNKNALMTALNLHLGKEKAGVLTSEEFTEGRDLLPKNCLASAWFNLKPVHNSPQGKEIYKSPRDNSLLTVFFGGYTDIVGRSPYFCVGLTEEKKGFQISIRAPRGAEEMGADRHLHLPSANGPGSLPLLEPKGVLYSSSFYFDIANIWKQRDELFTATNAKNLVQADKNAGPAIGGVKLSRLLEAAGAYHRVVVVNQSKNPYKRQPQARIPAFAFVTQMRDPNRFGRSMETILRVGAFAATQQFKMNIAELTYKDVNLVGYRFDEKAKVANDPTDIRFNFSPCFAQVGDQFIFCSSIDLCRNIIDTLKAEPKKSTGNKQAVLTRFYPSGFAELLKDQKDALITQTILDQAVPPAEANKQVEEFLRLVKNLGGARLSAMYAPKSFQYDIQLNFKK